MYIKHCNDNILEIKKNIYCDKVKYKIFWQCFYVMYIQHSFDNIAKIITCIL